MGFKSLLFPASLVYRAGQYIHKKSISPDSVGKPVISVGNISSGGTGKTPVAMHILKRFKEKKPAVVSRGYGRKSSGLRVVSTPDYIKYGDEPAMMKRRFPDALVIVSEDRLEGAAEAAGKGAGVIILDDGFQSYEIKRDLDLVVINCMKPFGGALIPAGRRREPMASLSRAEGFLLNRSDAVEKENLNRIKGIIRKYSDARIFHAREKIAGFCDIKLEKEISADIIKEKGVCAISAIGNPEGFYRLLRNEGASVSMTVEKKDHYLWKDEDMIRVSAASAKKDLCIVTTEKDALKIPSEFLTEAVVMKIEVEVEEKSEFNEFLGKVF